MKHLIAALLIGAIPVVAGAAVSEVVQGPAVTATLITAENGVAPNASTLSGGLRLQMGEGWKTYWRSPGEVGLPPQINWENSENVASVDFQYPAPHRFEAFGIENFGYKNEVIFPLQIMLETPGAPAVLTADVEVLVCSEICVPEFVTLSLEIPKGAGIDVRSAALVADWIKLVPDAQAAGLTAGQAHINADQTLLTVSASSNTPFAAPDVFPELASYTSLGKPDIRLDKTRKHIWAQFPIFSAGEDMSTLALTVTDGVRAGTLPTTFIDTMPEAPFALAANLPIVGQLLYLVAIAFLGGLILNIMPCVLPVLSIKLNAALAMSGQSPSRIRRGFLASAAGVLAFMWLLAALTMAAKAAGMTVGWGLQFQSPTFLIAMVALLAFFVANLFGAFEILLPQSVNTSLANAESSGGYWGDFATGAFAAVMATPCSAPFLGTAIAFALAGQAIDVVVIFTALGIGLASPYLLIALRPHLVSRLPKPGRWMIGVKIAMGILLLLTILWMLWVLQGVAGTTTMVLAAGLIGLSCVLIGVGKSFSRRVLATSVSGLIAMALLTPALSPDLAAANNRTTYWTLFDRGEIARQVSLGQTVFVDVTADWCLTCKANKALVLDRGEVAELLQGNTVLAMQADWTRADPSISTYLESFGRYGIPFNAVYGPGAPSGIALQEVLTQAAVLEAIANAGRKSPN